MSSFGVLPTGFNQKTLTDIKSEIESDQRSLLGSNLNQSSTSVFGQLNGVTSEQLAQLWEVSLAIYNNMNPETAIGAALDAICAITGTTRLAQSPSIVTSLLFGGSATTTIPAGSAISSNTDSNVRFETDADVTLHDPSKGDWTALTAYAASNDPELADTVANDGNVYMCITAGTSDSSGGPTGTDDDITDGTCHWKFLTDNPQFVGDVRATCTAFGPSIAASGALTNIETPVSGWASSINLLDATLGRNTETDTELRKRRRDLLRLAGEATLEAVRADILDVDDVTQAIIFENDTDVTDGDGVPAKAFESVVQGGDDELVRAAVWKGKPVGIQAYGNNSGTIVDTQGISHTIAFSRPTPKPVYMRIDVTTDSEFPSDGAAQIQEGVALALTAKYQVGDDVIQSEIYRHVFDISGVVDVSILYVGFVNPAVASANLTIGSRELATFDSSRITVNVS